MARTTNAIPRQIGGQPIKKVALLCVTGKFANKGAIFGISQQFVEPNLQVFQFVASRSSQSYRAPLWRDVV
jgi:hypothetical protein